MKKLICGILTILTLPVQADMNEVSKLVESQTNQILNGDNIRDVQDGVFTNLQIIAEDLAHFEFDQRFEQPRDALKVIARRCTGRLRSISNGTVWDEDIGAAIGIGCKMSDLTKEQLKIFGYSMTVINNVTRSLSQYVSDHCMNEFVSPDGQEQLMLAISKGWASDRKDSKQSYDLRVMMMEHLDVTSECISRRQRQLDRQWEDYEKRQLQFAMALESAGQKREVQHIYKNMLNQITDLSKELDALAEKVEGLDK